MTVRLASASRLSLHLVCHSERSEESTANEEFPLTSPCFGYRRNVPLLAKERDVCRADRVRLHSRTLHEIFNTASMDSSLRFAPFRMTVRLASASRLSLHLVCHSERSEESTANEDFPLTSPCFGSAETSLSLQRRGMSQSRQGEVLDASLRSE